MSLAALKANVAQIAEMAAAGMAPPKLGLVSSYDPDRYAIKARLMPEDTETGWLPIITAMSGQGWGVYAGPAIGDQCVVVFQEGDAMVGACLGFLPSDDDLPPKVLSGELHLVHKGGAFIKLLEDGKVHSKGEWLHDGDLKTTGDITDRSDSNTVTVEKLRTAYNTHGHPGVQLGGSVTPPTNKPAT